MNTVASSIQDAEVKKLVDGGGDEKGGEHVSDNAIVLAVEPPKIMIAEAEIVDIESSQQQSKSGAIKAVPLAVFMPEDIIDEYVSEQQAEEKSSDGTSLHTDAENMDHDDGTKNANSETSKHQGNSNVDRGEAFINNVQALGAVEPPKIMMAEAEIVDIESTQQQSKSGAIKAVPLAVVLPEDIIDESVSEQQTERESSDGTSLRTDAENTDTDDGTKNANSKTSKHQGNSNVDPGEAFINNVQASGAEDKTIIMEVSSDEEVTDLIKKRKAAYPLEGGSSKKQKNVVNIAKIMKDWGVSFEDAVIFAEEHRKVELNNRILERDSAFIKRKLKDMGTFEEQIEVFNRFKRNVKVKESALTRLERAKYRNIEKRRVSIDEILKVRATKPASERILKITITRRDPKGGIYTEVAYVTGLGKYGYIEWMQMLKCIEKQKGKNAVELREALNRLITKVKGLGLIAADKAVKYPSSASVRAPPTGRIHDVNCLLPFGTVYINNTLPVGVHPVQHLHITHPEQGMFYMDGGNQMCFQRAAELSKAPTEHLFELRLECMGHIDLQKGFHLMISMELYKRKDELKIDKFQYVKPEIESDVIEFWTRAREVLGQV